MKQAGIKVWVLTGDKIETAINIGVSAGLLDASMEQYIVEDVKLNDLSRTLNDITKKIRKTGKTKKQAIIIAGDSLVTIESEDFIKDLFLKASDLVDVVLACRVSPRQKAEIVVMIRHRFPEKITLAIGDGANDVSMIMAAHVGIGILGKEGQQAARSSDFAIG
jgi:phospholipid-transporting ATPase